MTKVCFLLSKDPVLEHGGDVEMSRLLIGVAAESFDVSVICLSAESGSVVADFVPGGLPLTRVAKPAVRPLALALAAVRRRRSLVHVRFDSDALVAAIESSDADTFVAEHSYMAESFLRSSHFGKRALIVNTHVSEALVWGATRGLLGRVEAARLVRDELRVALAADAVGTFDAEEAAAYRARGVASARWLGLTLPPADQVDIAASGPRLVLMGTRDWPPNQEAYLRALALWPAISAGIPGAELCVIGARKSGAPEPSHPDGVRDLGFVDDLHAFLGSCRAMIAPIVTGGGVRVKILDAARIGLPVVGTSVAVGSLGQVFDLPVFDGDDAFVAECRRLLTDRDAAVTAGRAIFQANSEYWQEGRVRKPVDSLIRGQLPDSHPRDSDSRDSRHTNS
ncbi:MULTISPECIES: glycosyltransferase family 4 protein [unclassified Mycobacterium]|uniref:glycosyltransferase n=1 Tax=unclassified Mycobacterium TaxID=2642494 RepID=UPI0029C8A496|nr:MULTISPECIES: glycosyltransferase family 4 protein [unclassified Mycobacterium]